MWNFPQCYAETEDELGVSKNLLARFIHNRLPSFYLLPMNHTFFVILWVTILHHTLRCSVLSFVISTS
jgi:hypothetical protein